METDFSFEWGSGFERSHGRSEQDVQSRVKVRFLSIPAKASDNSFGIFENLMGFQDGVEFPNFLRSNASKYYGVAAIEFIKEILKYRSSVVKVLEDHPSRTAIYVKLVIRQIFNFAKSRDLYFFDNPATKVKIKQKNNSRTRFLTEGDGGKLLDELIERSVDLHDMALLSLYCGLRAGEIFDLQWEHILWNIDRFSITDPKNSKGRMEPMYPLVKEMLLRRYGSNKEGYVFKSRDKGRVMEISNTFQRTIDKLGFNKGITDPRQKVVFRTLRHIYASWLVMGGVDLYYSKTEGHKNTQMTERYAHLAPERLEKAVNTLKRI